MGITMPEARGIFGRVGERGSEEREAGSVVGRVERIGSRLRGIGGTMASRWIRQRRFGRRPCMPPTRRWGRD